MVNLSFGQFFCYLTNSFGRGPLVCLTIGCGLRGTVTVSRFIFFGEVKGRVLFVLWLQLGMRLRLDLENFFRFWVYGCISVWRYAIKTGLRLPVLGDVENRSYIGGVVRISMGFRLLFGAVHFCFSDARN